MLCMAVFLLNRIVWTGQLCVAAGTVLGGILLAVFLLAAAVLLVWGGSTVLDIPFLPVDNDPINVYVSLVLG